MVVTGGSKGIGRAIATALLKEGARVAICARNQAGLEFAQQELSELGDVRAQTCDLENASQTAGFVEWACEQLGGIDILVSNVSAGGNDFRRSVDVDIVGAQVLMARDSRENARSL